MSCKVENLEKKNMVKLTIEVSADELEKALEKAYQKNKNKINVQGFRAGKAPRALIEKMYGVGVFYEDAANELIPDAYEKAAKESGLDIVSRPEIDVVQIEKGKEFIFTAEVAVKPEVTLGKYKGIEVEKADCKVSDKEVTEAITREQEQNARLVTVDNRAAALKDTAVIDYEGFADGKAFDGGKGTDYNLELGSHSFIDGFEDQIVGKNVGDSFDVNVTFPTEYHAKELAGKPAVFKVTLKALKVKELPALDDDFAQDVSDFDTFEEYKKDVEKKLKEQKEKAAKTAMEDQVVDAIIEDAKMDIPDAMVDATVRQMAEEFSQRITSQGLTVEQYFKFTGMNANTFMANLRPQAVKRIQSRLVLEAVANAEGITVSDEDMEKEFAEMAKAYQMDLDKMKELVGDEERKMMKTDLAVQKAIDLVTEAAKAVAKKAPAKKSENAEATEGEATETAAKKPAAKKTTTAKKTETAEGEETAKPAAKKTTTAKKAADGETAEKKPAAKKTTAKKTEEQ